MGDQAALQDGPSTVQQRAELSLWEEPPQHLLPGPRAEPPVKHPYTAFLVLHRPQMHRWKTGTGSVPEQGEVGGSLWEAEVVAVQAFVILQQNGHRA